MPRNKIEDLPEARLLKYQPVVAPPIAKWFLLLCFAKVLQVHFFSIDLPDSAQRSTQHPSLTAEKKKKKVKDIFPGRQKNERWFKMPFITTFRLFAIASTRLNRHRQPGHRNNEKNFQYDIDKIKYLPTRDSQ